ncbi:MAG: VWA domain-containing protein [Flavobacteriales bacterium]|nr:VWA domain-containing protein [Flavobacteriales bacterium]
MRNLVLLNLLVFISAPIFAQTQMSQQSFDLGEISLLNEDVVDLSVKNLTSKDIFILRIDSEENTSIKYTSKTLAVGRPQTIRIKLNPSRKGKTNKTVKVYLSSNSDPIELNFSANIKAIPKDNKQACPDFRNIPTQSSAPQKVAGIRKKFYVTLYDEISEENHIAENRATIVTTKAVTRTETAIKPPSKIKGKKVRKTPEERRNSPSLGKILFGKQDLPEVASVEKDTISKEIIVEKEEPEVLVSKEVTSKSVPVDSLLLDDRFKPNNIVFLIDASTSMKQEEKMDILKEAMITLLEPLRSIDYISIVTYSGEAKVVLAPTSGDKKEAIAEQIRNLNTDGSTNAVKGIKKAIVVGKGNFIDGGNNQIFLASDGAFDIGERNQSLRRKIESTAREGLTITVLGIKNDNWTNKSLKEIAELGKGDLIRIKSMTGASKVLKEVKKKAAR